jgi:hypothetical protein
MHTHVPDRFAMPLAGMGAALLAVLVLSACGANQDDPAEALAVDAEPSASTSTEAASSGVPEVSAADHCVITVEQAADLVSAPIQFVRARQLAPDVVECGYFEQDPNSSGATFTHEFRPGTLNDSNGDPIDPVAGLDARFKDATGSLVIQFEEGVLLDLGGFSVGKDGLVAVAEAVLAGQGG